MSEVAITNGIIAIIQSLSEFENADVSDNDWGLLDQERINAPYVIMDIADDIDSTQVTMIANTVWGIKAHLVEPFTTDAETRPNLRARRQAIFDAFNEEGSTARSAGGISGVNIRRIYTASDVDPYYDIYIADEEVPESEPEFLMQTIVFEVEEF